MKLAEWLIQTPSVSPEEVKQFDVIVARATTEILSVVGLDKYSLFVAGRVQLLYMMLEHGIPDDLEEIAHGESIGELPN